MFYVTIGFLLIFVATDLYKRMIPNTVLIVMFFVILWLSHAHISEFLIGFTISAIFILILYSLKFFAGGDAKLLIILGTSVGYPNLFYLFLMIFLVGGLQAFIYKHIFKKITIPYVVSILLGYILFILINFSNLF